MKSDGVTLPQKRSENTGNKLTKTRVVQINQNSGRSN